MTPTDKLDMIGYAFIRDQIMHSGTTPSLRQIGKVVGYASPRSVQLMLSRLQKRRLISYSNGVMKLPSRKPTPSERTADVPLVGSVACGAPSLAEQEYEALFEVSTKIARPGHRYFLLRAIGSSMNKSGIKDGDLVLVRQQSTADEGERVVALLNGDATIKHFHRKGNVILLKPNSTVASHKPIVVTEDFAIQGVVTAVLPKSIV